MDAIIVLDHERVYNDLVRDMPKFVKVDNWTFMVEPDTDRHLGPQVVLQPKSGGVVSRNQEQRNESRWKDQGMLYISWTPISGTVVSSSISMGRTTTSFHIGKNILCEINAS